MAKDVRENYLIPYIIITSQAQGCAIATSSESFHLPGFNVVPVDPGGADDAFTAGVVFGMLNGWDIREIARFASACQAVNLLKKGTQEAMGTKSEIQDFLATHPLPES